MHRAGRRLRSSTMSCLMSRRRTNSLDSAARLVIALDWAGRRAVRRRNLTSWTIRRSMSHRRWSLAMDHPPPHRRAVVRSNRRRTVLLHPATSRVLAIGWAGRRTVRQMNRMSRTNHRRRTVVLALAASRECCSSLECRTANCRSRLTGRRTRRRVALGWEGCRAVVPGWEGRRAVVLG